MTNPQVFFLFFSTSGLFHALKETFSLWTKARESAGCVFFRIALLLWSHIFVLRDLLLRMSMNGANFWSGSPQRPSALKTKGFSLSYPLPD